ncbi:MAG: polysaccharide biosynthesis/export family protein [Sulfuricurvum sp.]|uniref:polysaccharide biosynthesis/export family protein n=1 Tax=Sulfuricurvum sp. TaxID=2025608 RepID=UPI002606F1A7|nr:polysaccharide biosynthesis/export family protein [Sulfuricurvum sp.]MDD2368190.1 polysaccharide biosynthesis/export family protein [Sulfuricurvum sp.]MDD5118879.1 polysaccharide biosynthesis/export family protein [Sulfuricurvum sp.]
MLDDNGSVNRTVADTEYNQETSFEWKIAKGDRLEISVSNQSSSNGNDQLNVLLQNTSRYQTRDGTDGFLVPTDGAVRLPLVGAVKVSGLTETEATEKLTNEYKNYLKNPYAVVKILNQKLFVLGEVNKPGVVQVTNGTMSLFEALAYSGDLTNDAERTNVKIIRGGLRKPLVREINLANIPQMQLTSLILQPNDIVYVQPRDMKAYNVAFKEQMPFFEMLSSMLAPFVSYTSIKNGKAVDVFLFK